MSQSNFVSFEAFATRKYLNLSDGMQSFYGSFSRFIGYYTSNTGFSEWLDTLRGINLEEWQMDSIARTYFYRANRDEEDVLSTLVFLARHYDITFPTIEGCLTVDYWKDVAYYDNWYALYRDQTQAA